MSNNVNIELFERASQMIDYFQDRLPAELIERDLAVNDLEALSLHVSQAEAEASRQEVASYDCL